MNRFVYGLALVLSLSATACGDDGEGDSDDGTFDDPSLSLTGDPLNGASEWQSHCSVCHGNNGEGTPSADFAFGPRVSGLSDAQIVQSYVEGSGDMAPVNVGSDQDKADLLAYIKQEFK